MRPWRATRLASASRRRSISLLSCTRAAPATRCSPTCGATAAPSGSPISRRMCRTRSPRWRAWILERYREAVAPAGWRLAAVPELTDLFDTAERGRYANRIIWPALALLRERAAWGFPELAEVERWFRALDQSPVLDVGALTPC